MAKRQTKATRPTQTRLPAAGEIAPSKNASRRAMVLIGVHVLAALHIAHFTWTGRSISPVEPSEAMYTLELGLLNAGFVFFVLALASTLVFGRFFCGWGCHMVALQDLCGWMMKRVGIKPKPFRSRLLALGPLVLAFYMFVWPTLDRVFLSDRTFPGLESHFVTNDFWRTFPGPVFAILTFVVCGFAAVYFLGAKGFCTYGCPYGAFFGLADRVALGRIVVSDACNQCGHCTATCTSNVLIHEEIKTYGQIVDSGCMKCMDCVSVCPNQALSFTFKKPTRTVGPEPRRQRRYGMSWPEEIGTALVGLAATLAFRGLYDGPPLLMAIGLGAITGFVALLTWRMLTRATVKLQNRTLKAGGQWSFAGRIFVLLAALWLAFSLHSAFVQSQRWSGRLALEQIAVSRESVLAGSVQLDRLSASQQRAHERARRSFQRAHRWGLVATTEVELGLAWTALVEGNRESAVAAIERAIMARPDQPELHDNLIRVVASDPSRLRAALENKLARGVGSAGDHFQLANVSVDSRPQEAIAHYREAVRLDPDFMPAYYNLGGLLRRLGRAEEARDALLQAASLDAFDRDVQVELGLALASLGQSADAIEAFRQAIRIEPNHPEALVHLPRLIESLEQPPSEQ